MMQRSHRFKLVVTQLTRLRFLLEMLRDVSLETGHSRQPLLTFRALAQRIVQSHVKFQVFLQIQYIMCVLLYHYKYYRMKN